MSIATNLMAPTMLAVVISFLLQVWLTRKARYPSLYEAQLRALSWEVRSVFQHSCRPCESPLRYCGTATTKGMT
ncbi:hypothetical protein [Thiomonas sp. 13-64-67]|uniref:hypothetical protein n=1 Tax=Thiomonas sp. 13-64-67 TaxID=1970447 RepID=UPI00257DAFBB|nr:hypothetical protein [Thiomonas sp. 13-64-67]